MLLFFQPMRELEFLGTYPKVPKMQIRARFVNYWHYSVKQWHTLVWIDKGSKVSNRVVLTTLIAKYCIWKKLSVQAMIMGVNLTLKLKERLKQRVENQDKISCEKQNFAKVLLRNLKITNLEDISKTLAFYPSSFWNF